MRSSEQDVLSCYLTIMYERCTFVVDRCTLLMYTVVSMTATELRKKLFPMLDLAVSGRPIEFSYKGRQLKIVAEMGTSKLARLRPQSYTIVSEREMALAAEDLKGQMQAEWLAKWDK